MKFKPRKFKQEKTEAPLQWLDWPAPVTVKACFTERANRDCAQEPGKSIYGYFNLGMHVGDQPAAVAANRKQLQQAIGQESIHWLQQVHGTKVVTLSGNANLDGLPPEADAACTREMGQVCSVMTADCLPVFFCNLAGDTVAVAHAGWRGLAAGILLETLKAFADPRQVIAYLGPAISQKHFEVGDDVRSAFLSLGEQNREHFQPGISQGKWQADLYGLAKSQLLAAGVQAVYGGDRCTFAEIDHFYSYRRDRITGRMASLIWLEKD